MRVVFAGTVPARFTQTLCADGRYTPVRVDADGGYVELLVKIYNAPYGKMGNHMDSLGIGDELEFKGPLMKLPYRANAYVLGTRTRFRKAVSPSLNASLCLSQVQPYGDDCRWLWHYSNVAGK